MEKSCFACGKILRRFSQYTELSDGIVCAECLDKYIHMVTSEEGIAAGPCIATKVKEMVESIMPDADFSHTQKFGNHIAFDEGSRRFGVYLPKNKIEVFRYDQISSFALIENGSDHIKGRSGSFGIGLAGDFADSWVLQQNTDPLRLKISLKDSYKQAVYVSFVSAVDSINSYSYERSRKAALKVMGVLKSIVDAMDPAIENKPAASFFVADEILKLKKLLDSGIITQEEFQAKKKKLLDL